MNLLHDKLTELERHILQGLCAGQSFAEIAAVLRDTSPGSVRMAAFRMYPKIGASCAIEAAYKWGCGEVREPDEKQLDAIVTGIARLAGKVVLKRVA